MGAHGSGCLAFSYMVTTTPSKIYSSISRVNAFSAPKGPCLGAVSKESKERKMGLLFVFNKTDNASDIWPYKVHMCAHEGDENYYYKDEDFVENSPQKNLPSVSLVNEPDLGVENISLHHPSGNSKETTSTGSRLIYLEERDEEILSKRLTKLSRLNKVKSALELFWSMKFLGLRPNSHASNSLISCLLRKGSLNDALQVFEFIKSVGRTTGHTYSLILKAVADMRGCDLALSMFEELERSDDIRKHFDAVVYNTMISVFGKKNSWIQAERTWRLMQKNGYLGTTVTYELLVCIFVRCGNSELAIEAYREMHENGLKAGDDVMQAIIGACSKEGKWDLALEVFDSMLVSGMKPNAIACNALINSLGKGGQAETAFEVYKFMKSSGLARDAYTWNSLLIALNKADRHSDVLWLFDSIKRNHSSILNSHIYETTLVACQRLRLWDRALQILWQIEASGVIPSTASYNLVVETCEAARKPKVALQVYHHMIHLKLSPNIFTLSSLIRSCIWGSLWKEVDKVFHSCQPNGYLYNAAIQGMCLNGQIALARKLYLEMRDAGLEADGKTRALMLQNLRKSL